MRAYFMHPSRRRKVIYVPVTPAGTYLMHLESGTEDEAINKLLNDAKHMPYDGWKGFQDRGYTISKLEEV
jgi:hypothetical protein